MATPLWNTSWSMAALLKPAAPPLYSLRWGRAGQTQPRPIQVLASSMLTPSRTKLSTMCSSFSNRGIPPPQSLLVSMAFFMNQRGVARVQLTMTVGELRCSRPTA